MPKTDTDPISPLDVLVAEIDKNIDSQIERLLACPTSEHDRIVGIVKGLGTAKQRALELRKQWHSNEPEPDVIPVPAGTPAAASRRLLRRV